MIFSWFKRFVIERSHASFRSGSVWRIKFKTILMHCTGLVRFAVSHKVLKHLRWYFALYAGRSSKLTPSFILNLVSFFTLIFEFIYNTLILHGDKSCISMVLFKTMHISLIRNWGFESCCSEFRRRWTWFLRIIRWTWLLRSYAWEIFWVAKCWITFRVLANWISFWYPNILFKVYKR